MYYCKLRDLKDAVHDRVPLPMQKM